MSFKCPAAMCRNMYAILQSVHRLDHRWPLRYLGVTGLDPPPVRWACSPVGTSYEVPRPSRHSGHWQSVVFAVCNSFTWPLAARICFQVPPALLPHVSSCLVGRPLFAFVFGSSCRSRCRSRSAFYKAYFPEAKNAHAGRLPKPRLSETTGKCSSPPSDDRGNNLASSRLKGRH